MQKIVDGVITVIALPLMILNLLGGIVAGIWLAILGSWGLLGKGLIFIMGGHWICGLLMMLLSFPLGLLAFKAIEKGWNTVATVAGTISIAMTYVVIAAWCLGTFSLFLSYETSNNVFPLLLWIFTVATAPWSFLASKERDNEWTAITLMFTQIGLLGAVISYGLFDSSFYTAAIVFAVFLFISFIIQAISTAALVSAEFAKSHKTV